MFTGKTCVGLNWPEAKTIKSIKMWNREPSVGRCLSQGASYCIPQVCMCLYGCLTRCMYGCLPRCMYGCMCVYVCLHTCVCMYVCLCVKVYVWVYVCLGICLILCVFT